MAYIPTVVTAAQLTAAIAANPGPKGDTGSTGATGSQGIQGVAGTSYNFVDGEAPSGVFSGLNTQYTLAHTPAAGNPHVYIAGLRVTSFSLSAAVLTIVTTLVTGAVIVDYRY